MALSNLYEPAGREGHASLSTEGKMYVWGGGTLGDPLEDKQFATNIEQFDPYLEVWSQSRPFMVGTPHLGQNSGACAPFGELMYVYGGYTGKNIHTGILSCLDLNTHTWSLLCPAGTAGGPMRKIGCGMVHFHHDKLAVIGGYGFPSGSTQPGSTFIRNIDFSDGRGWTNEVHIFDLSQGTHSHTCAYYA